MNEGDTTKDYKSGDTNVASDNESNDVVEEDESDEVFFPVTIVRKTKTDVNATNNQQGEFKDETAVVRCFDLSVAAHMNGTSVPQYEPLTSDSNASR